MKKTRRIITTLLAFALLATTLLMPTKAYAKEITPSYATDENGTTCEENALIKAKAIANEANAIVLADDSGLEIDFLDKAPGVLSARYMGEDTPYEVKNAHILELLKDVQGEERSARFVCAIAAVFPDGREFTTYATIEGEIAHKSAGENGFGYDPIFFVPEFGKTTAELSSDEKNKISHRGKALTKMKEILQKEI